MMDWLDEQDEIKFIFRIQNIRKKICIYFPQQEHQFSWLFYLFHLYLYPPYHHCYFNQNGTFYHPFPDCLIYKTLMPMKTSLTFCCLPVNPTLQYFWASLQLFSFTSSLTRKMRNSAWNEQRVTFVSLVTLNTPYSSRYQEYNKDEQQNQKWPAMNLTHTHTQDNQLIWWRIPMLF